MTDQNLTEIVAVLDRSGSMAGAISDVIGGYNRFIKEQREVAGECRVTLVIFDNRIEVLYEGEVVRNVKDLTQEQFFARGMTRLADAVGTAITRVGGRLASLEESRRPGKVVVFVSTDGIENASIEYTMETVRELVKTQESEFSWQFIFTGADIDSYAQGAEMGMATANIVDNAKSAEGQDALYGAVSDKVAQYRVGAVMACSFTDEEKHEVEKHRSKEGRTA